MPKNLNPIELAARDWRVFWIFAIVLLTMPIWMAPLGGFSGLYKQIAVFGLVVVGFNLLFGLTGYLSFGHAAFIGVGSYAAVWAYKLFSLQILPAIILSCVMGGLFAFAIGYFSLRRSGIYFSILTLAFAEMMYRLAYSVLTPITNGETALQVLPQDPIILDRAMGIEQAVFKPYMFGNWFVESEWYWHINLGFMEFDVVYQTAATLCALFLLIGLYIAIRITRSPFGMMLKAIKANQNRLSYTGVSTRPYLLTIFVISGMYAGLAGGLLSVADPLAGAEKMHWTASGEIVIMTILGGVGTFIGPIVGVGVIEYFESILSTFNSNVLENFFSWLPEGLQGAAVWTSAWFVGEGWHLTLGILFVLVIIFLPGGIAEGARRMMVWLQRPVNSKADAVTADADSKGAEQ